MIIFFDGECALCSRAVRFLWKADRKKKFQFAPLQGETAKRLKGPRDLNTLVLLDDQNREYRFGKGALRICWHLSGLYKILGLFSFLPNPIADAIYRLIAKKRHLFQGKTTELPSNDGRLLP